MIRSYDSSAISSSASIDPASFHSSRFLYAVWSQSTTRRQFSRKRNRTPKLARASRSPLDPVYEADDSREDDRLPFAATMPRAVARWARDVPSSGELSKLPEEGTRSCPLFMRNRSLLAEALRHAQVHLGRLDECCVD
jgi:hypothetical protein